MSNCGVPNKAESDYMSQVTIRTSRAPSAVAASHNDFTEWITALGIQVIPLVDPVIETDLKSLLEFRPPCFLAELQDNVGPISGVINAFQHRLRHWALMNYKGLVDEDQHNMQAVWPYLISAHNRISTATEENAKEFVQRRGIDDLLEWGFLPASDKQYKVNFKANIRLCRSIRSNLEDESSTRMQQLLSAIIRPDAIADVIVTISRPYFVNDVVKAAPSTYKTKWIHKAQWTPKTVDAPSETSIIVFAAEYKCKSDKNKEENQLISQNQLCMDLSTAQRHRRAIGLPDRPLYGATSYRGIFRIHVSWWPAHGGGLAFAIPSCLGEFDLNDPLDILRCFSFLRNLKRHFVDVLDPEFQGLSGEMAAEQLNMTTWRMDDRPRDMPGTKRRQTEDNNGRQPGSGGQHIDNDFCASDLSEDGCQDFTQEEMDVWTATAEEYRKEAHEAWKGTSGVEPMPLDVIKDVFPKVESSIYR